MVTVMNDNDIQLPSNRKFGFFFTFLFLVLGSYFLFKSSVIAAFIFYGASLTFFAVSLAAPTALSPLNRLWMGLGLLMGRIINPLVLGLIYFAVLTPLSFVLKLAGRDELKIRMARKKTYWVKRSDGRPSSKTFKNQF